jgi:hypothetical protein
VSLSDDRVHECLRHDFECAWFNIKGESNSGASFSHAPRDPAGLCLRGNGEHNIQLLTLTPQGEIFHVLSGYVGPEELTAELEFAADTYRELAQIEDAKQRREFVTDQHRRFLETMDERKFEDPSILPANAERTIAKFQEAASSFAGVAGQIPGMNFGRQRATADHRFAIEHPLLDVSKFRSEMLVGKAATFFGSTGSGGQRRTSATKPRQSSHENTKRKTP